MINLFFLSLLFGFTLGFGAFLISVVEQKGPQACLGSAGGFFAVGFIWPVAVTLAVIYLLISLLTDDWGWLENRINDRHA